VWGGREIVKVAAHFESIRMLDPADLHRLNAGRSDQPLDSSPVVVGRVEKDSPRWSGSQCPAGLATVDLRALAGALGVQWDCPRAVVDGQ
jgi:hypothetical protein